MSVETDGPQFFRTLTGKLGVLSSSWGEHRFLQRLKDRYRF